MTIKSQKNLFQNPLNLLRASFYFGALLSDILGDASLESFAAFFVS